MLEIPEVLLERAEKILADLHQSPVDPDRAEPLLLQIQTALEARDEDALRSSLKALYSLQEQPRDRATMLTVDHLKKGGGWKARDLVVEAVGPNKLIPLLSELQDRVRELREAAGVGGIKNAGRSEGG